MEKILNEGLKIKATHYAPYADGVDAYRLIISFIGRDKLLKEYHVWVTQNYAEDLLRTEPTETMSPEKIKKAALEIVEKRYCDLGGEMPEENGVDCSNDNGCKFISDVQNYMPSYEIRA